MRERGTTPRAKIHPVVFVMLQVLALQLLWCGLVYGAPQEEQRKALGSLTTVGEVQVNGMAVASDSTIFAGDILRSSGTGSATLTWAGKGSLQISANTEIMFTSKPQYDAELKLG